MLKKNEVFPAEMCIAELTTVARDGLEGFGQTKILCFLEVRRKEACLFLLING